MSRPHKSPFSRTPVLPTPAGLTPAQGAHFRAMVDGMHSDHFTPADLPALVTAAAAAATLDEARKALAKGRVIEGKVSPWVRIEAQAARELRLYRSRLKLDPAGRMNTEAAARNAQAGSAGAAPGAAPLTLAEVEAECATIDLLAFPTPEQRERFRERWRAELMLRVGVPGA